MTAITPFTFQTPIIALHYYKIGIYDNGSIFEIRIYNFIPFYILIECKNAYKSTL